MSGHMKASEVLRKLLIEKEVDGFTVVELRDAAASLGFYEEDLDQGRKKIYRQILRFIKSDWLSSTGDGREKRYYQTELFRSLSIGPKHQSEGTTNPTTRDYSVLHQERDQYKAELEIILGEIEEYQSIKQRFPELEPKLAPLVGQAKERSAHLLGKVNVLTNVLNVLSEDTVGC